MQVSLQDLQDYIANKTQPKNGLEFVGYFSGGPLHGGIDFNNLLKLSDAKQQIHSALDRLFSTVDWSRSFDHPLAIIYDEVLKPEALIEWHWWLRTNCADIKNIYLFLTHSIGSRSWWDNWCQVHHQKSFVLVDALPSPKWINRIIVNNPGLPTNTTHQQVCDKINSTNFYFSYFGGSGQPIQVNPAGLVDPYVDRMYLTLEMLDYYQYALIDFASLPSNYANIEQYVEYITYFKDQDAVDRIKNQYYKFIANDQIKTRWQELGFASNDIYDPRFKFSGFEFQVNQQCFASVIRETLLDGCINTFTEKTCRPFFNYCMAIPTGYLAVEQLQQRGFWFPTDLIDYQYQYEQDFYQRIQLLKRSLTQLTKHSIGTLKQYALDHVEQLHQNHCAVLGMKQLNSIAVTLPK
jgi:hypothetical protein